MVTFTADLGQGEELEPARRKAEMLGIKQIYIDDLREEFVPISCSPCSGRMRFMKASICSVPPLPGR